VYLLPFQIAEYVNNHYTTGRMALVGMGIEHDDLLHYAKQFNPASGPGVPTAPAKFSGGKLISVKFSLL
jgi:ubiquinol-cytochrome c reductase core subunit 2